MSSHKTNKYSKKRRLSPKPIVLATLGCLLLLAALLFYRNTRNQTVATQGQSPDASASQINLDPPTEEDLKDNSRNKDDLVNRPDDQPSDEKKKVTPVITFVGVRNGNVDVRSYVSEVYEATGTCTATLTKDGEKVSREVEGLQDATYTRCDRVLIPVDDFDSSGKWLLVVTYESPTASGSSESKEVLIP